MDAPDVLPIDNSPHSEYVETINNPNKKYFNEIITELTNEGKEVLGHTLKLKNYNNFDNEECAICFGVFDTQTKISNLDCKHFFHESCAIDYREVTLRCPVCRIESKNITSFASLQDLINNTKLECINNSCYYTATVQKANKIISASEDKKSLFKKNSTNTKVKIKNIITTAIKDIFDTEDNDDYLAKNQKLLENTIKNIKVIYKGINYNSLDEFIDNYKQRYHCPYPIYNFHNQNTLNFLQENEQIIISILKKIILDNLKTRIEIAEANFDPENNQILITLSYDKSKTTFKYKEIEEHNNNLDIYNKILDYLYVDIMMIKLSLDYPNFFKKNKTAYIDSWNSKDDVMSVKNDDNNIEIKLTDFFDDEAKKINFEQLKNIIASNNIDYSKLHEPVKEIKIATNSDNNIEANNLNIQDTIYTETSLNIGNGSIMVSYKITMPNFPVELAYESSPNNQSTTFFIKFVSTGQRYRFIYELTRVE